MRTDSELLQSYATAGDEAAFAELVRRHIGLVYGSAVRLLNGDAALAEDITQKVFTQLAQSAAPLAERESPAGWLHTTTRNLALNAIRAEQRRRAREQEASTMNEQLSAPDLAWAQLRPLIDEAVGHLPELDRNAVLLRFFEDKSHREVGAELGVGENAARMRVERAVEKLRDYFARHGVTTTVALLTTTLGTHGATSAPLALADTVAAASLSAEPVLSAGMAGGWKDSKLLKGGVAIVLILLFFLLFKRPTPPPETPPPAPLAPTPVKSETSRQAEVSPASTVAEAGNPGQSGDLPPPEPVPPVLPPEEVAPVVVPKLAAPPNPAPSQTSTGIADWGGGDMLGLVKKAQGTDPAINEKGERKVVNVDGKSYYVPVKSDKFVLVDTTGVLKGKTITAIAGGSYRRTALCADGTLVWWGLSDGFPAYAGKDNKPTVELKILDTAVLNGKKIIALATGQAASMVLCEDGTVYEWGYHQPRSGLVIYPSAGPVEYGHFTEMATAKALIRECYDHFTPQYPQGLMCWYNGTPLNGVPMPQPHNKFYETMAHEAPVCMNFGALSSKKVSAISYDDFTGDAVVLCTDGSLVSWGEVVEVREAHRPLFFLGSSADGLPVVLNDHGLLNGKTITAVAGHNVLCSDGSVFRWPTLINGVVNVFAGNFSRPELKNKTIAKITTSHVLFTDGTLVYWLEKSPRPDPAMAAVLDNLLTNIALGARTITGNPAMVDLSKLKNKQIVDIAGEYGSVLAKCADGTLAWINGAAVDRIMDASCIPAGKTVLAISPYMVLFGDKPADEKVLEASPVKTHSD